MRPLNKLCTILCVAMLLLYASGRAALGQQDGGESKSTDDVLRVNTELVQTGVTVFDKQGRFVDGLKKEDFELRVDGRPVPISFFENIVAGSQRDRLARAAGKNEPAAVKGPASAPSFRQRTIVFFLDDRHLSLDSVARARKMLLDFINTEMGRDDLVAVASASGQIGFLQQFTDNKDVLRAAVERVGHHLQPSFSVEAGHLSGARGGARGPQRHPGERHAVGRDTGPFDTSAFVEQFDRRA